MLERYPVSYLPARRRRWVRNSGIPSQMVGLNFSGVRPTLDDVDRHGVAKRWLEGALRGQVIAEPGSRGCGKGLRLWGPPGHGKTTIAAAILGTLIERIDEAHLKGEGKHVDRPFAFAQFSHLINLRGRAMRPDVSEDDLFEWDCLMGNSRQREHNVRVLVIDDLGKEYATKWTETQFENLLRRRYYLGYPTIVTTNMPPAKWAANYGEATSSFAREAFLDLEIVSPTGDRR